MEAKAEKVKVEVSEKNYYTNDEIPLKDFVRFLIEAGNKSEHELGLAPTTIQFLTSEYEEGEVTVVINGMRDETSEEVTKRLNSLKAWEKRILEDKRRQYEALKKEFGDG